MRWPRSGIGSIKVSPGIGLLSALGGTSTKMTNQGTSTCVVFTEGGGYGFNCKHRCAGKGWKEFRAELEARFTGQPSFRFV